MKKCKELPRQQETHLRKAIGSPVEFEEQFKEAAQQFLRKSSEEKRRTTAVHASDFV